MQVQAKVLVVHVQHTGVSSTQPEEWARELVTGVADDLSAFHLDVRTEIRKAPRSAVVREIAEAVSQFDPHLVVLGSRRPSELRLLFGGSVSAGVVRRAICPVMLVRDSRRTVARRRRVLVALAGYEDLEAVTSTIPWLLEPSSEVVVWHGTRDRHSAGAVADNIREVVEALRSGGYQAQGWLEPEVLGLPDDIRYAAEDFAADMLAVGARRMSELSAFLRGSVSRRVAHLTDLPVLVVPTRSRPEQS